MACHGQGGPPPQPHGCSSMAPASLPRGPPVRRRLPQDSRLPGGVIGKGDLSSQADITNTLLLPGGVIGKGDLSSQTAITKTLLLSGGIIGISRLSECVSGFLKTLLLPGASMARAT